MSKKLVTYESCNGVAKIGLNDPSHLNVLSRALVKDLNDALDVAESDNSVIVLYGHGRAFCAGGDLKEFTGIKIEDDFIKSWERLNSCKLPVIAAVHGYAIGGGCELMLMADYVVAAHDTKFGQPELKLGFIPGCGATQRLKSRVGYGNAFNLIASANIESFELADRITDKNSFLNLACDIATEWCKQGRMELINLKSAMRGNFQTERQIFYEMVVSDKAQNLMQQFLSKS